MNEKFPKESKEVKRRNYVKFIEFEWRNWNNLNVNVDEDGLFLSAIFLKICLVY